MKGNTGRKQRGGEEREGSEASGGSSFGGVIAGGLTSRRPGGGGGGRALPRKRTTKEDRRLAGTKLTPQSCYSPLCSSQRPMSLLTSLTNPKAPRNTLEIPMSGESWCQLPAPGKALLLYLSSTKMYILQKTLLAYASESVVGEKAKEH